MNPFLSVNSPALGNTARLRIFMKPVVCVRLEGKRRVRCLASSEDHLGEADRRGEEDHTKIEKSTLCKGSLLLCRVFSCLSYISSYKVLDKIFK